VDRLDAPAKPVELLVALTRCPVIDRCLNGASHHCSAIVASQHAETAETFQVPEPWSGHIAIAPILFISSNPSIDYQEAYPVASWQDAERAEFFESRFDRKSEPWVDSRMRPRLLPMNPPIWRMKGTRFWRAARARAGEMLRRPAIPGRDFAMTEVVQCKSVDEIGVVAAQDECARRWLRPVIQASGCRVVALFGSHARAAFRDLYGVIEGTPLSGPLRLEGRDRLVLQLPHPTAFKRRRNCAPLTRTELSSVNDFLLGDAAVKGAGIAR
jgi:hypothetical protein